MALSATREVAAHADAECHFYCFSLASCVERFSDDACAPMKTGAHKACSDQLMLSELSPNGTENGGEDIVALTEKADTANAELLAALDAKEKAAVEAKAAAEAKAASFSSPHLPTVQHI